MQSENAPLAFFVIFEFFVVNPLGQNGGNLKFSAGRPNLVCGTGNSAAHLRRRLRDGITAEIDHRYPIIWRTAHLYCPVGGDVTKTADAVVIGGGIMGANGRLAALEILKDVKGAA